MHKENTFDKEIIFNGTNLISETDTSGIITYVNRSFCELMGYSKDELIGKSHTLIRHPDMPHIAFQEMWNRLSSGKRWSGHIKNLHKDGSHSWVLADIIAKYDEKGNITGYIASRRSPGANLLEMKKQYKKFKDYELKHRQSA